MSHVTFKKIIHNKISLYQGLGNISVLSIEESLSSSAS